MAWETCTSSARGDVSLTDLTAYGFQTAGSEEPRLRLLPTGGLPAARRDERLAEAPAGRSRKRTDGLDHHRRVEEAIRCSLETGRQVAVPNRSVGHLVRVCARARIPPNWQTISHGLASGFPRLFIRI